MRDFKKYRSKDGYHSEVRAASYHEAVDRIGRNLFKMIFGDVGEKNYIIFRNEGRGRGRYFTLSESYFLEKYEEIYEQT